MAYVQVCPYPNAQVGIVTARLFLPQKAVAAVDSMQALPFFKESVLAYLSLNFQATLSMQQTVMHVGFIIPSRNNIHKCKELCTWGVNTQASHYWRLSLPPVTHFMSRIEPPARNF